MLLSPSLCNSQASPLPLSVYALLKVLPERVHPYPPHPKHLHLHLPLSHSTARTPYLYVLNIYIYFKACYSFITQTIMSTSCTLLPTQKRDYACICRGIQKTWKISDGVCVCVNPPPPSYLQNVRDSPNNTHTYIHI
jgi:hypothetical protein